MLKVVVLDNDVLTRKGTAELIKKVGGLDVVAEFACGRQLMDHMRREHVGLLVMEWRLVGSDGLDVLARMLRVYPKTRVLVVSSHLSGPFPARIWAMGVSGLLSRNDDLSEFNNAISTVLKGERFIGAEVSKYMFTQKYVDENVSPFDSLTDREMQVLMMVIEGENIQEISLRLCITKKTVNTYRYRLFDKLSVKNEVDLTRLALRYGVLDDAFIGAFERPGGASGHAGQKLH